MNPPWSREALKHDFVLSPIPFNLWGSTARLVVHVRHEPGTFKHVSEALLEENISILVSEASRSAFHYDTWTIIACFDEIESLQYDGESKAFTETLKRIESAREVLLRKCADVFFVDKNDVHLRNPVSITPHNAMSYFYHRHLQYKQSTNKDRDIGWAFYKDFCLICENNDLKSSDGELKRILQSLDAHLEDFLPCNIFATMNTFDRNIRAAMIPHKEKKQGLWLYGNFFSC